LANFKNQNNNRIDWIRAARVLLQSRDLGKSISSPEFQDAFFLLESKYRSLLYRVLTLENEDGSRASLPPQFFYGVKDWNNSNRSLDETAILTGEVIKAEILDINSITDSPTLIPLAEQSIVAVYEFLEYPENYRDRLLEQKVWEGSWLHAMGTDQGARRYIAHKTDHFVINGELLKVSELEKKAEINKE